MIFSKDYTDKVRRIHGGEKINGKCLYCGEDGTERVDNGLLCGCFCEKCFYDMIRSCRSKSW